MQRQISDRSRWPIIAILLLSGGLDVHASDTTYKEILQWLASYADAPTDGLAPGAYGRDRLDDLSAYLPPGFADEFDFDRLVVDIEPTQHFEPHVSYRRATDEYMDKATIGADGRIDGYVAGKPFSTDAIEAAALGKGGYMVAWNHVYRWQFYGYATEMVMSYVQPTKPGTIGRKNEGIEGGGDVTRHMTLAYQRVYLAKLAMLPDSGYRMAIDDSDEIFYKEHMEWLDPFDVKGTHMIIERPLDATLGDQVFSYLPTERRVRRLSAKERADRVMGSNFTLDDVEAFSGRILDNNWTYLGRKVVLHVADSKHDKALMFGPGSNVPNDRWQLRPCFVVEAIPGWDGHPYGRRILFFDAETFSTVMSLVVDREDSLWKVFYTVYKWDQADNPDAAPASTIPLWRSANALDLDNDTATISISTTDIDARAITPAKARRLFDVSNLTSGR